MDILKLLFVIECDRIAIKKGPLLGYANLDGQELVAPQYITVDSYCEGMSLVSQLDPRMNADKTAASMEASGSISGVFNYSFIDPNGKTITVAPYILAHRFQYGLAFVENANFEWGYITYDGTEYFE